MHECGVAEAPEDLWTDGAGPCVLAAIICDKRGFLIHSPDPTVEYEDVLKPLLAAIDRHIPQEVRKTIRPLLAGGAFDDNDRDADDGGIRESTMDCRWELRRVFREAGFGSPWTFWAQPGQIHKIHLNLDTQTAELTISPGPLDDGPKMHTIKF
jgi:hypothetical protein